MRYGRRTLALAALCLGLFVTSTPPSSAETISGGDLVMAGERYWSVFHPNGDRAVVLSAGAENATDVEFAPDGSLYLLALADNDAGGTLYRMRQGAGLQVLSSGGSFAGPAALAIGADGSLFVADQYAFGFQGAIFQIDLVTGAQREVVRGFQPRAVVVLDDSTLVVGGVISGSLVNPILLVDRVTGVVRDTLGAPGFDAERLALGPDGVLWAGDYDKLYRVTLSPFSYMGFHVGTSTVFGIDVDADGSPLVGKRTPTYPYVGSVLRFNRSTFQFETLVSDVLVPTQVWGMARVPGGVTPARPTTWGALKDRYAR